MKLSRDAWSHGSTAMVSHVQPVGSSVAASLEPLLAFFIFMHFIMFAHLSSDREHCRSLLAAHVQDLMVDDRGK